jgi:hypothetical protein
VLWGGLWSLEPVPYSGIRKPSEEGSRESATPR